MAWLTPDDLEEHVPLDVVDANGMVIRRRITGFDPVTGEVESSVLTGGRKYVEGPTGEVKRRREFYPAPLTWRTISRAEVRRAEESYWDFDEGE